MSERFFQVFKNFAVFFAFSFLIYLSDKNGLLVSFRRTADMIIIPLKLEVYQARSAVLEAFSVLSFWKSGEARVRFLEQKVLELEAGSVKYRVLEGENNVLREQLRVSKRFSHKLILANVVGLERYLAIDVGFDDGVKEGMAVIINDALVGRVKKVMARGSLVILPVDPDEKIAVFTIGKTGGAKGITGGDFGTRIILDKVLQKEPMGSGDILVTSGEGGLSKDLVVGTVEKVSASETDVFKKADVKPAVSYDGLKVVFVVTN